MRKPNRSQARRSFFRNYACREYDICLTRAAIRDHKDLKCSDCKLKKDSHLDLTVLVNDYANQHNESFYTLACGRF